MKTNYFQVFFVLFAFTLVFIAGCNNPCKDKDCANGTCNKADGSCDCDPGWLRDATGKCSKEDLCYNKECGHGTCMPADGTCLCDVGYEINVAGKCDSISRTKFLGAYIETDQCTIPSIGSPFINNVTIVSSAAAVNTVIIQNYAGYTGLNVTATIIGNTITVDAKNYTANGFTFDVHAATGTITGISFTLLVQVDVDGTLDSYCNGVFTKQ